MIDPVKPNTPPSQAGPRTAPAPHAPPTAPVRPDHPAGWTPGIRPTLSGVKPVAPDRVKPDFSAHRNQVITDYIKARYPAGQPLPPDAQALLDGILQILASHDQGVAPAGATSPSKPQ